MRAIFLYLFLPAICYASASELDEIHKVASSYTRPITFLTIADESIVSSLASSYQGVFVHVDPKSHTSSLPNTVHLKKTCTSKVLAHLGECEHFDLVFVKNHGNELNGAYAKALYHLGEHVFVSLDRHSSLLAPHLVASGFQEIKLSCKGIRMFFASHPITYLKRTHWLEPASDSNFVRHIHSTYSEKIHYKNLKDIQSVTVWQAGINLMTFKILEGSFPNSLRLEEEINRLYKIPHPDWMPNNILVQGENLVLIDDELFEGGVEKTVHDPEMLGLMVSFVKEQASQKTQQNYRDILSYCRLKIHGRP